MSVEGYVRPDYVRRVYTAKRRYYEYLPLKEDEILNLSELDRIKEVHLSNLIEGNTYTYEETKVLIEKDIPSALRAFKEAMEIKNLNNAVTYCNEYPGELTEDFIKLCHGFITQGTLRDYRDVGNYRTVRNFVGDINTSAPNAINKNMGLLIEWYNDNKDTLDPIVLAVRFKYRFVCIHPFIDGNGRVSRLIMNWILKKNGICQCDITKDLVNEYYESLRQSNKEGGELNGIYSCVALEKFICKCLVLKYNQYISMLEDNFI